MGLPRKLYLKQNYITNASRNATEALSMALHLSMQKEANFKRMQGVYALIKLLNANACALRNICESIEYEINFPEENK